MNRIKLAVTTFALCLAASAWAADNGSALKNDDIKAEPFRDAKTVAKLATGDKVEILLKDGGWFKIKSAKGSGWVRMLSIRRGDGQRVVANSAGLLGLASGRSGSGQIVSTTGIRGVPVVAATGVRGLNEEELKGAKFDQAELARDESYAITAKQAQQFADQGGLTARPLAYLPQ